MADPIIRPAREVDTEALVELSWGDPSSDAAALIHDWTITTEAKVVEVAWRLWELSMGESDFDGAIWTARRGLLASGNAELTEAFMRVRRLRRSRRCRGCLPRTRQGARRTRPRRTRSNDARALGRHPVID